MRKQICKNIATLGIAQIAIAAFGVTNVCRAATVIGDPVTLSTLIQNPQVTFSVGSKTFSEFQYSQTGQFPSASSIAVVPIRDDNGNFGVRFSSQFVTSTGISDAMIKYKVSLNSSYYRLTAAQLSGNPASAGSGFVDLTTSFSGSSQVLEIFAAPPAAPK